MAGEGVSMKIMPRVMDTLTSSIPENGVGQRVHVVDVDERGRPFTKYEIKVDDSRAAPLGPELERVRAEGRKDDPVNHPKHYTRHPSGVECIEITRHMGFNLGNVVKYVWRADLKGDAIEDLKKARWYLDDEIKKREASAEGAAAGRPPPA